MYSKEEIETLFKGKIEVRSNGLSIGELSIQERTLQVYQLKYVENRTAEGILGNECSIFITDSLTGCFFIAYSDIQGTHVVHINNKLSSQGAEDNQKRFKIYYNRDENIIEVFIFDIKENATKSQRITATDIAICCFPEDQTEIEETYTSCCKIHEEKKAFKNSHLDKRKFIPYIPSSDSDVNTCNIIGQLENEKWKFYPILFNSYH